MVKDWVGIGLGAALIGIALLPTPDDATVVSPLAQIGLGLTLIAGSWDKKEA